MTRISSPLHRETEVMYRGRRLVLTMGPRFLTIREKGRRNDVSVGYEAIYELGLKRLWQAEQAEKRMARRKR
jgi:hypothetical protein